MGYTRKYGMTWVVLLGYWLQSGACTEPKPPPETETEPNTTAEATPAPKSNPAPSSGGAQSGVADNGLTQAQRKQFYTLPEGSELFPMSWFLRLENVNTRRPFTEDLERFGLIFAGEKLDRYNLPIGLTRHKPRDVSIEMLGVNCAACHVGEIHYRGSKLRIDGAPNMFDIETFYSELLSSAVATLKSPSKLVRVLMEGSPAGGASGREVQTSFDTEQHRDAGRPLKSVAGEDAPDARFDAIGRSFSNLEALRVEGKEGAQLADELLLIVSTEAKDFEKDHEKHGDHLVASLLMGKPDPARPPSDDVLYRGALHQNVRQLRELGGASQLRGDVPLTRAALADPRSLQGWTALFKKRVRLLLARIEFLRAVAGRRSKDTVPKYGRVDAFGFARNFLFGRKHGYADNVAPISYPHLWGFEKFAWLHWNANTNSVLERNIGQALGVGAIVNTETWDTSLLLENLHALERLAYEIESPRWPEDILGVIQPDQARAGEAIYAAHCARCHEQRTETAEGLADFQLFPLDDIGTDPNQAIAFSKPVGGVSLAERLHQVLGMIKKRYYEEHSVSRTLQAAWEGGRRSVVWRSPHSYPARPLTGVWAVAPYLHNNSVPTLWHLLLPPGQRPRQFKVGDREYDPRHVGYRFELTPGLGERWIHDATLPGNHNTGHDYGTSLSEAERWALIEYLKTK